MFSPRGNIGLKKLITKKGNYIYLLIHVDGGWGTYIRLSQVAKGILDGEPSIPCVSAVQDLPDFQHSWIQDLDPHQN